ncbi:MAG TPA: hypothetical protein VME18_06420 [Acidobacteriaceae bacterium]|nr:hypothetical protein [Acidobacteriaceae bacterium]
MAQRKRQPAGRKQPTETIGGRGFGNGIEPTQAQMASGNQGLAAEPARTNRKMARKKAA